MTAKTLPCKLRIGATMNRRPDDVFTIRVTDTASHIQVCDVQVTFAEFAKALANGEATGTATWRDASHVGWVAQNKTEGGVTEGNLHEFEVDGWVARSGDIGNSHRADYSTKPPTYSVVFFRHVPPGAP